MMTGEVTTIEGRNNEDGRTMMTSDARAGQQRTRRPTATARQDNGDNDGEDGRERMRNKAQQR